MMKLKFWAKEQDENEKIEEKDKNNDDYIAQSIGAFGLWQFIYVTIVGLTRFVAGWNTMSVIFLTPNTNFYCSKFAENITIVVQNNTCYKYCEKYEYEKDIFDVTLITEFDLVCDKGWLSSFTQTVMMFGLLLGVSLFGWISDRFGRSKAVILAGVTNIIFMFAVPYCPAFWGIIVLRFFIGLGSGGIYTLTAVYTIELIGTNLIEVVTSTALLPDGLAIASFAIFAKYSSNWRAFTLEYSIVSVFIVFLLFFLPETPRWLIANGKAKEAIKVMSRAAKLNRRSADQVKEHVTKSIEALKIKVKEAPNLTYLDLFRTRKLAIRTVASFMIWFVTGISYFGLNQYVSQLGGNLITDIIIMGFLQVVAGPIAMIVTSFVGRKISAIACFITIGLSMFILIFILEGSIVSTVLGSIGITGATVVFTVDYLLVIELYPTPMRNMGFGLSSVGSKLGAMVAPFIVTLRPRSVATSIFAAAPFMAVFFCFLLPETKGKKLKDTIEECDD